MAVLTQGSVSIPFMRPNLPHLGAVAARMNREGRPTIVVGSQMKYMHFNPTVVMTKMATDRCAMLSRIAASFKTFFQPDGVSSIAALHSIHR